MQNVIQRFFDIDAGQMTSAGQVFMGLEQDHDISVGFRLRKLRVAPIQPYVEQLQMLLVTPGGIQIGPIDIPFTYNIETPFTGTVICPTPSAVNQKVMLILSDLQDAPNLYGATHLVQPAQNADEPIPDAVVAVTPYPSTATLTFKDGGGATIGTATGPGLVPRPRLAKTVASNSATPAMLYHY